jgi:beta-hydroxylase
MRRPHPTGLDAVNFQLQPVTQTAVREPELLPTIVKVVVCLFLLSGAYMHLRGRARHAWYRQIFDHSTFMAPLNVSLLALSAVPRQAYLDAKAFPELRILEQHWREIRAEALALMEAEIKAPTEHNDAGFNSFFKKGWKRFYVKWYAEPHPSARALCPRTAELVSGLPSVRAAMFAHLPDGAKLGRHRDPFAGSLRYHLGLVTPNDDSCYIDVDGERYSWRDGEGVVFDETFIHYAENRSGMDRIVLFCDIERPLKFAWARAFNRWVGDHIIAGGASPNSNLDPTGFVNHVFRYAHYMGEKRRAFKRWNRTAYLTTKFALICGAVAFVVLI